MKYEDFLYEKYNDELNLYFESINENFLNLDDFMLKISKIVSSITDSNELLTTLKV